MSSLSTSPDNSPFSFPKKVLTIALVVVLLYLFYTVFRMAFEVFLVFFAAILFGIFLHGVSQFIHRHTKMPYTWALVLTCLLFFGVLIGGLWALGPSLSSQSDQLQQDLPQVMASLKAQIAALPYGQKLLGQIPSPEEWVKSQDSLMTNAFSLFSSTFGILANLLIILVIGIYVAASPQSTTRGLVRLVPFSRRTRATEVIHVVRYTLWGWLKGTLFSMLIIGIVTTIGLMIIGVPMSLLLGVLAGILEFIPNIGPFIASAPAVLLAFVQKPSMAVTVIFFFIAVQSLEGYVLTPMVQKKVIDLPPILTIMGQVVMGLIAGIWGLLLAVPMVALAMVLVKMLYIEDTLGDYGVDVKGEEEAVKKVKNQPSEV